MRALFFGSIGSIVETSELQRQAFNEAFAEHGLGWHWDQATYQGLLSLGGGDNRIASYAQSQGETVDDRALHQTKTQRFQSLLTRGHWRSARVSLTHSIGPRNTELRSVLSRPRTQ